MIIIECLALTVCPPTAGLWVNRTSLISHASRQNAEYHFCHYTAEI
jgi:hypothetical protein